MGFPPLTQSSQQPYSYGRGPYGGVTGFPKLTQSSQQPYSYGRGPYGGVTGFPKLSQSSQQPYCYGRGPYGGVTGFPPLSQVQGKDPSVDFTQDLVEESEDERGFDEMSDSVPPIELPAAEESSEEDLQPSKRLKTAAT